MVRNNTQNSFVCWKALVEAFPLVGDHLLWCVGNGMKVRLGEDPWVGSGNGFKFPKNMLNNIHSNGIIYLKDASIADLDRAVRSEWKTTEMMDLHGEEVDIWRDYVATLNSNFILLKEDEEDALFWAGNDKRGIITTKLGYLLMAKKAFEGERKWWWKFLWEQKAPIKYNIFCGWL
jgi:hypothetical protein